MQKFLLGAHTSIEGGVHCAIYEGHHINATTVQLFTANQRTWHTKTFSAEALALFKKALLETGLSHIMSHASYLINLGSPKEDVVKKSKALFRDEVMRCKSLGISYVVLHPGATLGASTESALERVVLSLKELEDLFSDGTPLQILIETTAGQGTTLGGTFEEIAYIVHHAKDTIPIGVCVDTCHIFAAGYDIRDAESFEATFKKFDTIVGYKFLQAFHINDSKKECNSRVDRHEQLGAGMIGLTAFRLLMNEPKFAMLPKYLETPGGPESWKKELVLLKSFVR